MKIQVFKVVGVFLGMVGVGILAAMEPAKKPEAYLVAVTGVHDGDTFTCDIQLGFEVVLKDQKVRVLDFDAWELTGTRGNVTPDEKVKGATARDDLRRLFTSAKVIRVLPGRPLRDKYGRLLLKVMADDIDVATWMKERGHSREVPTIQPQSLAPEE